MPINYRYDAEKDAIYATIEGKFTYEEFQLTLAKITETESFAPNTRILWDLRNMDFSIIDWDFSKQLVDIRAMIPKRANTRAALVANKTIDYGITEMHVFQSTKLPQEIMVFSDFDEAEQWLLEEEY